MANVLYEALIIKAKFSKQLALNGRNSLAELQRNSPSPEGAKFIETIEGIDSPNVNQIPKNPMLPIDYATLTNYAPSGICVNLMKKGIRNPH